MGQGYSFFYAEPGLFGKHVAALGFDAGRADMKREVLALLETIPIAPLLSGFKRRVEGTVSDEQKGPSDIAFKEAYHFLSRIGNSAGPCRLFYQGDDCQWSGDDNVTRKLAEHIQSVIDAVAAAERERA